VRIIDSIAAPNVALTTTVYVPAGVAFGLGCGTATLNIPTIGTASVIFYEISPKELLWLGTTPDSVLFSGSALQQSGGPFAQASLQGTNVFALWGFANPLTNTSLQSVGLLTTDGTGNITGTVDGIVDSSGTVQNNQSFIGTYSVAANGRGALNIFNQSFVIWLVTQNSGFVLEAPNSLAVQSGLFEPQASGPFSNASISGAFVSGGGNSALDRTIGFTPDNVFGTFSADGAGNLTGTVGCDYFFDGAVGTSALLFPCPINGTYVVSPNGRGSMTTTITRGPQPPQDYFFPSPLIFYMISPNTFAAIYANRINNPPNASFLDP
jgi:hypothetical protein